MKKNDKLNHRDCEIGLNKGIACVSIGVKEILTDNSGVPTFNLTQSDL